LRKYLFPSNTSEENIMKKQALIIIGIILATGIPLSVFAKAPCEKLLPDEVEVESCEGSDFCGVWGEAKWSDVLPHCLAVEGSGGGLYAVYAWGRAAQWNIATPGWQRVKANDTGDLLKLKLRNGARVEYEMIGEQLHGYYYTSNGSASIVMDRVPE